MFYLSVVLNFLFGGSSKQWGIAKAECLFQDCWLFPIYTVYITLITMASKHFSVLKMTITLTAFLNLLKPATGWHSFLSAARYGL